MSKLTFEKLVGLVEDAQYKARSYSGRGMYGSECLGITCDNPMQAILDIISAAEDEDMPDVVESLQGPRTDSMGTASILYFPKIEWEGEDVDEDDFYGEQFRDE